VTDALHFRGQNKYPVKRWFDLTFVRDRDNRSADEIALDVVRAAGLSFKVGDKNDDI